MATDKRVSMNDEIVANFYDRFLDFNFPPHSNFLIGDMSHAMEFLL